MFLSRKESGGIDLLFFTNTESHKTDELKSDPHVNISFLDSSGQWASLAGLATIETDRNLVKQHYNISLKAWLGDLGDGTHDGSENDPRIGVIRVKTGSATGEHTIDDQVANRTESKFPSLLTLLAAALTARRHCSIHLVAAPAALAR